MAHITLLGYVKNSDNTYRPALKKEGDLVEYFAGEMYSSPEHKNTFHLTRTEKGWRLQTAKGTYELTETQNKGEVFILQVGNCKIWWKPKKIVGHLSWKQE